MLYNCYMRQLQSYYSDTLDEFLRRPVDQVLGSISINDQSQDTNINQRNAWFSEILILKKQLDWLRDSYILFEYTIPRLGKRIDAVLLVNNLIFVLEFKIANDRYSSAACDQAYDYALDLHDFHEQSKNNIIIPIIVATQAPSVENRFDIDNSVAKPICCNEQNLGANIKTAITIFSNHQQICYQTWENSSYEPTPTIIEAARALYNGHNVADITRNDAGATNLTLTTSKISDIIRYSKQHNLKSICFVTGVPGAGKTLVGLNIAAKRTQNTNDDKAIFLSGNQPLVTVLQEALAKDSVDNGTSKSMSDARRKTSSFIQVIHRYRDAYVGNSNIPAEHIAIFDEAQRSWTKDMIEKFMLTKKGISEFPYSESEFLIGTMNRHKDWAVIICLVGGGQEIYNGEAGLPEWFEALRKSYPNWSIYTSSHLDNPDYLMGKHWKSMVDGLRVNYCDELHLSVSIRALRTPRLSSLVDAIVENRQNDARHAYVNVSETYPIFVTRSLADAKTFCKSQSRGSRRYGLLASSGAMRLKPDGIYVKDKIQVANWFLGEKDDVRSSYFLENAATEFDIQGLELDYAIVAWDADFRYDGGQWHYHRFVGNHWNNVSKQDKKQYLKNTYRVLLTRARRGMIIFVPLGSKNDATRNPIFYDQTYVFLKSIGIPELPHQASQ